MIHLAKGSEQAKRNGISVSISEGCLLANGLDINCAEDDIDKGYRPFCFQEGGWYGVSKPEEKIVTVIKSGIM